MDHQFIAVVHNVRPAGHIRPATSPHVARGVQQEMGLFSVQTFSLQWCNLNFTKIIHDEIR